jgi:hypothetical protein
MTGGPDNDTFLFTPIRTPTSVISTFYSSNESFEIRGSSPVPYEDEYVSLPMISPPKKRVCHLLII